VGHNPNSVSSVPGIDGASRNNKRPSGVTECFQVRKHTVEFHVDDSSNIFTKHPSWSCLRNNAEHFRPERTVISRAFSLPGHTVWLARESSGNKVGCHAADVSDVSMVFYMRPMPGQNRARIGLHLTESNGVKPCVLRSNRKPADATE
jgi:hypothetical protein